MSTIYRVVFPAVLLLGLSAPTHAQTPEPLHEPTQASEAATQVSPSEGGLLVFLDPETGEITSEPSQEQIDQLQRAIEVSARAKGASPRQIELFSLSGGGLGARIDDDSFFSSLKAQTQEDGTLQLHCGHADHKPVSVVPPRSKTITKTRYGRVAHIQ